MASTHSLESLGAGVEDVGITDASQTALDLAGSMTLLGWHRPTAIARIHTQQSKWLETGNQRSYRLLVNASNQIQYDYSDDGTAVRTAVSAAITSFAIDEHRHLAAVFISGTPEVQFYLDGLAFGAPVAIAGPGTVFNSTADYRVGNFDGGAAADNFRGQLDEIKLYSDERTAAEIFAEFQESPIAGASLVAGYSFDNVFTDISGGTNTVVNNGTAFNTAEVHGYDLVEQDDGRPHIAGDLDGSGLDIFFDLDVLLESGVSGGIIVPTPPVAISGGFTNFFEDIILNFIRGTSPTAPVTTYMSLHTADPGEDAAVGEVVGNGYARQVIVFGAPASGSGIMVNSSAPLFTASGGGWGLITHFAIWDSLSGGNPIQKGPTAADASVVDGDTFRAPIGTVFLTAG